MRTKIPCIAHTPAVKQENGKNIESFNKFYFLSERAQNDTFTVTDCNAEVSSNCLFQGHV